MKELRIVTRRVKGCCSAASCTNRTSHTLCASCRCRKSRLADPERYAYNNLKNRAKQRKKPFTLTLEEFREFCFKYSYIAGKGTSSESLTVDRDIEEAGYHAWNIKALPKGDNIRKYLHYDWQHRTATVSTYAPDRSTNNPF